VADRSIIPRSTLTIGRRLVSTSTAHLHGHAQRTLVGKAGNDEIGVGNLHTVRQLDIAGSHHARAFGIQADDRIVAILHGDRNFFQVQQDLEHILLDTLDGAVFVQYTFDFCLDDGTTRHRGQQDTAQGVAQRVPETALQRLQRDFRVAIVDSLYIDNTRLEELRDGFRHGCASQFLYLEYSSTINCSLISAGSSTRSG